MSEVKPVAGQWYELDGKRMYCIGLKTNGRAYMEQDNENFEVLTERRQRYLTHLPDCTGWDWEPETFPQYWTKLDPTDTKVAFVRRIDRNTAVVVYPDGTDGDPDSWYQSDRTRLTEAEALALLDPKPPQPAEDPEEWVEITDPEHVLREGVDHIRTANNTSGCWCEVYGYRGHRLASTGCIARCRRKDLPKPRRTVTLPIWLVTDSSGKRVVFIQDEPPRTYGTANTVEPAGFIEAEIE